MAETTYNITIPHTAPDIWYENFSTECPDSNGTPVCDNAKGFRVTTNSTAKVRITFVGSAIYIYGSADAGVEYSWSLDFGKKTKGTPNGDLLIVAENLDIDHFWTPHTHGLEIDTAQFISGTRFQFNKADVVVGTGMTGAQTFVDSYKPGNNSVRLTTGWTANDTISDYHYYQSDGISPLAAYLDFQGAAVWVWGFCGPRGQVPGTYGSVSVDDSYKRNILMSSSRDIWVDHKCLIYWQSGLNLTQQHNITYNAESDRVLLESFEVLRVVGGTRYEGLEPLTASLPRSRTSTSTTTGTPSPTSDYNSTDIRVLVPAITGSMIGVLVILCFVIRFAARRKRKREEEVPVVVHDQVPTYTPASIQPLTSSAPPPAYVDPPVPTRDSSGYYSAPVTTPAAPTQQPHDDGTVEEVKRLRQEVDAMMAVIHEQQHHQRYQGEDGGDLPPPEHQPTFPSKPNSSPPPRESCTAPQVEGGS